MHVISAISGHHIEAQVFLDLGLLHRLENSQLLPRVAPAQVQAFAQDGSEAILKGHSKRARNSRFPPLISGYSQVIYGKADVWG